jgi:hypothetical protein
VRYNRFTLFVAFFVLTSGAFANQAPSITLPASATPNPVQAGQEVTLSVAAEDPDGDTLTYTWTFGDGTPDALGATVTHVYTAPGVYDALILVQDGHGSQDNDFVGIIVTSVAGPLEIQPIKLSGTVSLTKTGTDTMTLAGSVQSVPASGNPVGRSITVNFGGLQTTISLKGSSGTAKALQRAASPGMSVTIKFKVAKKFAGGDIPFQVNYKHATLVTPLIRYGFDPFGTGPQLLTVPFLLTIGDAASSSREGITAQEADAFLTFLATVGTKEFAKLMSSFQAAH